MFDKEADGTMVTTHGGGTSRKRMHACRDYSGSEIMRTLRDEVFNRGITVVDFTSAIELIKDTDGKIAGVGRDLKPQKGDGVIDCTGLQVWPGLIDMHLHLYDLFDVSTAPADYAACHGVTLGLSPGAGNTFMAPALMGAEVDRGLPIHTGVFVGGAAALASGLSADELVQVLQAAQETPPVQTGRWLALCQLLLFLCRMQQNTAVPQQEKSSLHPQIRTVLAYIDENFRQQVTLETLSEQCFLDRHYLCRLFKRDTGLCIHDYITYRRLSCAAALLRAGESVSTAANRSGFSSDAFFITTFKKNVGMTPYRYACRYRSQQ